LKAAKKGNAKAITPKAQDTMLRTCAGRLLTDNVALTPASENRP
jgi:hypothetical protein